MAAKRTSDEIEIKDQFWGYEEALSLEDLGLCPYCGAAEDEGCDPAVCQGYYLEVE